MNPRPFFDVAAHDYTSAAPLTPADFVRGIIAFASLPQKSRILELGCGAGDLAICLARRGYAVTAVDISVEMLRIARKRTPRMPVNWIHSDVSMLKFDLSIFDLIFSFESFHLFPNPIDLVRTLAKRAKPNGMLAIGWCDYHWERLLEDAIRYEFQGVGIEWGPWGYQRCPSFSDAVRKSSDLLDSPISVQIQIRETSAVADIAVYLTSIDKVAALPQRARSELREKLQCRLRQVARGSTITGMSSYHILGSRTKPLLKDSNSLFINQR